MVKIRSNGVRILGTGYALPEGIITNESLESRAPTSAHWVESVLGVSSRRHLTNGESLLGLCVLAGERALANSALAIEEIDSIVVATSTPDFVNPSMAALVHEALGARTTCAAFDIQAVCSGYLFAMAVGSQFISGGSSKNVLIIGADQFSKITDFTKRDCVFFGDAAGASVLSISNDNASFIAIDLYTDPTNWKGFHTPVETRKFVMDGAAVRNFATTNLPLAITSLLEELKISIDDISLFFTHQPSKTVLDSLELELTLSEGVLQRNIEHRANTAGATIPLLMAEYLEKKKINSGALIGLAAVGSGWTWGAGVTRWVTH